MRAIPASAEPPIHLSPAAELAERVLLPGDPQRALAIAQAHLIEPRMFNTRRGLWGYTGRTGGGWLSRCSRFRSRASQMRMTL